MWQRRSSAVLITRRHEGVRVAPRSRLGLGLGLASSYPHAPLRYKEKAHTAYGAEEVVPLDVDILIAGTSCKDYR